MDGEEEAYQKGNEVLSLYLHDQEIEGGGREGVKEDIDKVKAEGVETPHRVVDWVGEDVKGGVITYKSRRRYSLDIRPVKGPDEGVVQDIDVIVPGRQKVVPHRVCMGEKGDGEDECRVDESLFEFVSVIQCCIETIC